MKLIIEIDEEGYKYCKDREKSGLQSRLEKVVAKGTPLQKIIDKIEEEKDVAYADFDEYKVQYLGVEVDDLPDDDFRYGMERALEIVKKCEVEE